MSGGSSIKSEFLLGAMTLLNWLWDTTAYIYSEASSRLGRSWSAFIKEEDVWHIFESGVAYPCEVADGDQPQWIYNATRNHLIWSEGGLVDPAALRHCQYIGGGIERAEEEIYDMTDFLTAVRIHGTAQPPVKVLLWAWAAWTGRKAVGWVASQRVPYNVVLMDSDAEQSVHFIG